MNAQLTNRQGEEFRDDLRPVATDRCAAGSKPAHRSLSPEELAPLTRLDPLRSSLGVLQTFGLLTVMIGVGLTIEDRWWLLPLIIVVVATQQHALFVLAHEAAHYRMFRSRMLNDVVGRLCGVVAGVSMRTYRVTHRLHHNHLYGKQDPDIALNGGYPRGAAYLVRKLLVDLTGWTAPKTFAYFFGAPAINDDVGQSKRPLDDTSATLRRAARQDRWVVAGFHLAMPLLTLWLAGGQGLLMYFLLWVLPLVTVVQLLLRLRAVAEHGAPAGYDSPLTAARTNLPGPGPLGWVLRFLLFPHHVNYHIEHHLYPAVPHYFLPDLHRLLADRGALAAAEVRPFGSTLMRIFAPRGSVPEAIRR